MGRLGWELTAAGALIRCSWDWWIGNRACAEAGSLELLQMLSRPATPRSRTPSKPCRSQVCRRRHSRRSSPSTSAGTRRAGAPIHVVPRRPTNRLRTTGGPDRCSGHRWQVDRVLRERQLKSLRVSNSGEAGCRFCRTSQRASDSPSMEPGGHILYKSIEGRRNLRHLDRRRSPRRRRGSRTNKSRGEARACYPAYLPDGRHQVPVCHAD